MLTTGLRRRAGGRPTQRVVDARAARPAMVVPLARAVEDGGRARRWREVASAGELERRQGVAACDGTAKLKL